MSYKIELMIIGVLLLTGTVLLSGCGTPNSQAPFDVDAQKHEAGWMPQGHREAVDNNGAALLQGVPRGGSERRDRKGVLYDLPSGRSLVGPSGRVEG